MRPLNICLISYEWPPVGCGIGTYMIMLAKGLAQNGHCVHVLTHDNNPVPVEGVQCHPVPTSHLRRFSLSRFKHPRTIFYDRWPTAASNCFAKLISHTPIDIIETAEYSAWGRYIHPSHIPLVIRCHKSIQVVMSMEQAESGHTDIPSWVIAEEKIEKQQALIANAIVAPSYTWANYVHSHWTIPREKIEVIPNPIDTESFTPKESHSTPDHREILFAGRLELSKGVYDFVEAAIPILIQYPDTQIKIIGMDRAAPENLLQYGKTASEVIQKMIPNPHKDRLHLINHIPVSDLISHYQNAYCSIMPTRGIETFSYIVAESMACATPVIATRCGGPDEIIDGRQDGILVPPCKPQELTKAMKYLLDHPETRETMAARARKKIQNKFSTNTIIPRIIEHYQEVIEIFCRQGT